MNVFPTRQNLQVMKVKLVGAKKGHSLLKKKADALTMRLRGLLKQIIEAKDEVGAAFKEGNFALAKVKYDAGDIKPTVLENVTTASKKVVIRNDNIAGVKVPVFRCITEESEGQEYTGLAKGGQQIQKSRMVFSKVLETLVQLGSLQTAFIILDEAIKVTNRRVNALDCVVVPKMENTVAYIKSELDELEREEFFRLKRSQNKKKADIEAKKKADMLAEAQATALNMEGQDPDIIF